MGGILREGSIRSRVLKALQENPEGYDRFELAKLFNTPDVRTITSIIFVLRHEYNIPVRLYNGKYMLRTADGGVKIPIIPDSTRHAPTKDVTENHIYKMLLEAGDKGSQPPDNENKSSFWWHIGRIRQSGYQVDCIDGTYFLRGKTGQPSKIIVKGVERDMSTLSSAKSSHHTPGAKDITQDPVYKMLLEAGDKGLQASDGNRSFFWRHISWIRRDHQVDYIDGSYFLRGKTGKPSMVIVKGVSREIPVPGQSALPQGITGNSTYKVLLAAGDKGHRISSGESIYALWNNISRIRKAGYQIDCIDGTYFLRGKTGKPSQIIVKGVSRSIASITKPATAKPAPAKKSAKRNPATLDDRVVYKILHDAGDKGTLPPVPGKYSFLRYVLQLRKQGYQVDCVDGTYILQGKTGRPSRVVVGNRVVELDVGPSKQPVIAEKKADKETLGDRILQHSRTSHATPQQTLFTVNKGALQRFERLSKVDGTTALLDKILATVESFNSIAQIYAEIESIQTDFSQKIRDRINTMFPSIER